MPPLTQGGPIKHDRMKPEWESKRKGLGDCKAVRHGARLEGDQHDQAGRYNKIVRSAAISARAVLLDRAREIGAPQRLRVAFRHHDPRVAGNRIGTHHAVGIPVMYVALRHEVFVDIPNIFRGMN